jgi:hypothetical protein
MNYEPSVEDDTADLETTLGILLIGIEETSSWETIDG